MAARKRVSAKALDQDHNIVAINEFRDDPRADNGRRRRQPGKAEQRTEKTAGPRYVKNVKARSPGQEAYIEALRSHDIVIGTGPAGTGKTYLAVCEAVDQLKAGKIQRIIISRPAVEAGENLGFLPGGLTEKMDPWMRPIYDAMTERMGGAALRAALANGTIEIAPIAYLRGRTLGSLACPTYTVVDESQNLTFSQIVMLLSRLGEGGTMVLTGDPAQSDLPAGDSGLMTAVNRLRPLRKIGIVELTNLDIVRHPLIAEMMPLLLPVPLSLD